MYVRKNRYSFHFFFSLYRQYNKNFIYKYYKWNYRELHFSEYLIMPIFVFAIRFLIFLDAHQFDFSSLFFFDIPLNLILQNFVNPQIKKII